MEAKVEYRKVKEGEVGFERIQFLQLKGVWICDSYDHNESSGCSNPDCFKNARWHYREWREPSK